MLCFHFEQQREIKIPRVPGKKELGIEVGHRGKKQAEVETPEALQLYIDATFDRIKQQLPNPAVFKERATYWQLNSRGKRHYDVVRTIIRDAALADFKYRWRWKIPPWPECREGQELFAH